MKTRGEEGGVEGRENGGAVRVSQQGVGTQPETTQFVGKGPGSPRDSGRRSGRELSVRTGKTPGPTWGGKGPEGV